MSYVDAIYEKEKDLIKVVERIDGKRVFTDIPANYVMYYDDPIKGQYKNLWGEPVSRSVYNSHRKLMQEVKYHTSAQRRVYESDINPIFRCLEDHFKHKESPILNIGFFDIEVDFDPERGFADPWDPFSPITAISTYLSSDDTLYTFCLKPNLPESDKDHLTWEAADAICNSIPNTILCNDEQELLLRFLDLIEDVDVLSGWNSKGFDIPYVINRIERLMGKDYSKRMCLWNRRPKKKKYIEFKKDKETYELVGRIHLDYLQLYKKHTPGELQSYRLDFVGELEVGENKVPYEGTLDNLYKRDFRKFIEYNRQDTLLLYKIDQKKRFIELANQIAHTNTVLIPTTMGSVALIEQAIINEAHERGMVVHDKKSKNDYEIEDYDEDDFDDEFGDDDDNHDSANQLKFTGKRPVVGAYVAKPTVGLHREIACCDINSLYPSTIRAMNMGPETLVGQIRLDRTNALLDSRLAKGIKPADCWEGLFSTLEYSLVLEKSNEIMYLDFEDGNSVEVSGQDLYNFIFKQKHSYNISANGTIFRNDVEAIIPGLLTKWYTQRQEMQFKETVFSEASAHGKGFKVNWDKFTNSELKENATLEDLPVYIKNGALEYINSLVEKHIIRIEDNLIFIEEDYRSEASKYKVFWNQRQQARKILLNSLYGAILNESCRFYDARIGQSVTLTGRSITKHMSSKANEILTGKYDVYGDAILYNDTDSVYFSAYDILKNDPELSYILDDRDLMVTLYDNIGDEINESFPFFMQSAFNTSLESGAIIKAGRELIASRGLFIKKKKYALLMYDKDSVRLDVDGKPGKLKIIGLDIKRSDTPKMMQDFLQEILMVLLTGGDKEEIIKMIKDFRIEFRNLNGWMKGTPKKVNGLTGYFNRLSAGSGEDIMKSGTKEKVRLPGHVKAALNWNTLRKAYNDHYSMEIQDGSKIIVCKLKPNPLKMDAIAYPFDEPHLPNWYKELPFDHEEMENVIIDKKVKNVIGVLNWDLSQTREDTTFNDLFEF